MNIISFSDRRHETRDLRHSTGRSFSLLSVACCLLLISFSSVFAQTDSSKNFVLDEVIVKSTRATEKTGMAFSNVTDKVIKKQNLGQDLPFLLNQLPSVVVTSDAGAGVGYTGIRIRGTDPTRINVTLNGIPYNDSESQGVYWVNMPDFASSVSSIQVQRGVGTSTNGAGAFGASINVNTLQLNTEAFAELNSSVGSFNTLKTNVVASTGLLNNHFVVDARLSKISSDGYIDRATSDLKSFYVSGGYYTKQNFVRLNVFSGKERTYQAWYGTPESLAKGDKAAFEAFAERNYLSEQDKEALWQQGRTYNFYTYENEVDDYQQDHYQLISSFKVGDWRLNPTLHYTYGRGFYEQFKNGASFTDYGIPNLTIGSETIEETDLIRRKWLDNHFYGGVFSLDYEGTGPLKPTLGGGWNKYEGSHFGDIIWATYATTIPKGFKWYENTGLKTDFNLYGKTIYEFNNQANAYIDLQYRTIRLDVNGTADALQEINYGKTFHFFNPKVGFNYNFSATSSVYGSFAVGNKEPNRTDFVDNAPTIPRAENLKDIEVGYRFVKTAFSAQANLYYMLYKDQLVLTGAINGVGESIRTNVPSSYRAGFELQATLQPSTKWLFAGNLTLSQNKIKEFTEFIVSYDETPSIETTFQNTDISFSPSIIAGGQLGFFPTKRLEISLLPKYVGKQYLDNTSNENRKLDAFFTTDVRVNYTLKTIFMKELSVSLLINNVFNTLYESNGYTYSYIYGSTITENYVYPQAGINFLAALKLRF